MRSDLLSALRPAIVMTILFALLLGLVYPAALTGIGQTIFPDQANGSLVRNHRREVIGSALIGQGFAAAGNFHGRPSAAGSDGYDATASSGSNLGPTSAALVERVQEDVAAQRDAGVAGLLPADMVTASGSGLDPDISPDTAFAQVPRVAAARGVSQEQVRALVEQSVERPVIPFLGDPHVNVLALNLKLATLDRPRS